MTENSFPFENADTTEAQFAKWASALVGSGVISGLATTVSSGLGLSVATGSAIIRGVFYENVTSAKALTVGAADVTARKDAVILKLDLAANTIEALVKAGTTAGGGTLPALTQNASVWEHIIAEVTVPGGATNLVSGNIVTKLAGVGLRVIDYVTAERPTPTDAVAVGLDRTLKKLEVWTGGAWYDLSPTPAWADITGKPATFAPSAHTHAYADITGKPATFAPSTHDHDDRYYQKATVDTALAGKSATGHTHAYADITGKPATFAPSSHTHASLNSGGNSLSWNGSAWIAAQRFIGNENVEAIGLLRGIAGWSYDIGGTRKAVWMDANGYIGFASSSKKGKRFIKPVDAEVPEGAIALSYEQLRAIEIVSYRRISELKREGKEPGYKAPLEIGVIAEQLHDAGLWPFVMYEGHGVNAVPVGVHYEILALAAIRLTQYVADQVDELRKRFDEEAAERGKLVAELAELRALITPRKQAGK